MRCSTMGKTLLAALALTLASALVHADTYCRAVDGDTIQCGRERIRLRNVYAPEMSEPGGLEARERMVLLLARGEVTLDRRAHDPRGRTIA